MPPDPRRVADTRAWLLKAADDLRAAQVDLAAVPPLTADAAFHCQQLTEKALKAFLYWHNRPFRRVHDLTEVGKQCIGLDPSLEQVGRRAERLTVYAWAFRYPGDPEEPTVKEAEEALAIGREVYEAILARLPAETRP